MKKKSRFVWGIAAALMLAAGISASGNEAQSEPRDYDHLVVGNTTHLRGDFFTDMWGNTTSDLDVRKLIHSYSLVNWNFHEGKFEINNTAVSGLAATENSRGDHKYQIALYEDMAYSDGTPITAWDYAFSILLHEAPQMKQIGADTGHMEYILGAKDYENGSADVLAGVNVLNDHEFTVTVSAEYLPYFYELGLLAFTPYPISVIAPGCKVTDDGSGIRIVNEDEGVKDALFTAQLLEETVLGENGYRSHPSVTSGPYVLDSFDGETAAFSVNPYFKGDAEGMKPVIGRLEYTFAKNEEMIGQLQEGRFDLLNKVSNLDALTEGVALAGEDPSFSMSSYPRSGLSFIAFTDQSAAVKELAVRQALAWGMDRQAITDGYEGNYGLPVEGYFGLGQWMVGIMGGSIPFPVQAPAEDASGDENAAYEKTIAEWEALSLDGLSTYNSGDAAADLDEAVRVLEEAGWTLNADGGAFVPGTDSVRCKQIGGELVKLELTLGYPAGNAIGDLLETYMAQPLQAAGIVLKVQEVAFSEILSDFYGQGKSGCDMLYLATNFDEIFDPADSFHTDENGDAVWGYSGITDNELYEMAQDMRRTKPGDTLSYMKKWVAFQERFSGQLPVLPVYSNVYFDFYTSTLQDYDPMKQVTWSEEILYAVYSDVPAAPEVQTQEAEETAAEGGLADEAFFD